MELQEKVIKTKWQDEYEVVLDHKRKIPNFKIFEKNWKNKKFSKNHSKFSYGQILKIFTSYILQTIILIVTKKNWSSLIRFKRYDFFSICHVVLQKLLNKSCWKWFLSLIFCMHHDLEIMCTKFHWDQSKTMRSALIFVHFAPLMLISVPRAHIFALSSLKLGTHDL